MNNNFIKPISFYLNNDFHCYRPNDYKYKNIKRIVVLGDIHGDFKMLVKCLVKAKVIDREFKWIGGKTHVVCVGDLTDKSGRGIISDALKYEEFSILELLTDLDSQSQQYGGRVHYLPGNHELYNLLGNFKSVHPSHMKDTGIDVRHRLFKPGGFLMKRLACFSYGILKINNWYFCHAGILPHHFDRHSIDDLNSLLRDILRGDKSIDTLSKTEYELIFGEEGFLWTRKYANDITNRCTILDKTMEKLNDKDGKLVIGHTPSTDIRVACNNRLYLVDTAMSSAFDKNVFNKPQILEIKNNKHRIIYV